jgi:hypothetical protein
MTSPYMKTELERDGMTKNESNSDGLLEQQTTGEDRVRMVTRQLSEPRTAGSIASSATAGSGS